MNINLNTSQAFYNKTNTDGDVRNFSSSFHPASLSLQELSKHIRSGHAFTVGYFTANRRVESSFVSSQLLALDLDKCPLTIDQLESQYAFIRDYAFMMYPTPSSTPEQPKTRILFVLDEVVTSASRWRVLQLGLMAHFAAIEPDPACKDPSRLFYGSDTQRYYANYDARLPLAVAGGLTLPQANQECVARIIEKHSVVIPRTNNTTKDELVNTWFNKACNELTSAPAGERHAIFVRKAYWLFGLNAGGWPISKQDIERELGAIARGWGDAEGEIERNLRYAEATATPVSTEKKVVSPLGKALALREMQRRHRTA